MLSAEWTLLNDPERLRQTSPAQFLTLQDRVAQPVHQPGRSRQPPAAGGLPPAEPTAPLEPDAPGAAPRRCRHGRRRGRRGEARHEAWRGGDRRRQRRDAADNPKPRSRVRRGAAPAPAADRRNRRRRRRGSPGAAPAAPIAACPASRPRCRPASPRPAAAPGVADRDRWHAWRPAASPAASAAAAAAPPPSLARRAADAAPDHAGLDPARRSPQPAAPCSAWRTASAAPPHRCRCPRADGAAQRPRHGSHRHAGDSGGRRATPRRRRD